MFRFDGPTISVFICPLSSASLRRPNCFAIESDYRFHSLKSSVVYRIICPGLLNANRSSIIYVYKEEKLKQIAGGFRRQEETGLLLDFNCR